MVDYKQLIVVQVYNGPAEDIDTFHELLGNQSERHLGPLKETQTVLGPYPSSRASVDAVVVQPNVWMQAIVVNYIRDGKTLPKVTVIESFQTEENALKMGAVYPNAMIYSVINNGAELVEHYRWDEEHGKWVPLP